MNYKHAPLFALLLLAGCAQDWNPARLTHKSASAAGAPAALASPVGVLNSSQRAGQSFAAAPDNGDLVAYPTKRVVRQDGAYTWHRADLSEAHALAAIVDGRLSVTAPSGEKLDFRYERHVEHPSGDWTWVGRLENGAQSDEVVLTFGAKAAFGTIAQPGGKAPLKLTLQDGVSWLIETDRAKIADVHNRATRPHGDDYLVSPKLAGSRSQEGSAPLAALAPAAVNAATSSGVTVDVVLGYTTGFASALGGESQAVTRLNNLVDIANQAFANAQVTGRVRLVHTVQVNYPDNTSNSDALEKLTGYKSGSGKVATDAAFNALRAAREQYGADLVSLVRKFNDPENDGCGIAWMIGGGQSGFHSSDEYFGYSVVADGRDQGTDGKTYFCREETLAHELGHNMGSQHDRTTATENGTLKYGAYPYSFGYKTDATNGNFYTVMAYGESGQASYRTFSNPRSTFCGGRACGIVDQSDVARSLGQTMPLIANFRTSVVSSRGGVLDDINGDGKSDLIWFRPTDGRVAYWLMDGPSVTGHGDVVIGEGSRVVAIGDFDANGRADLVVHRATGELQLWAGDGASFQQRYALGTYPQGWRVLGARDVDGDGKSDLLWFRPSDGLLAYWIMNGATVIRYGDLLVGAQWWVQAMGDFNGDGRVDLIWNRANGDMQYWGGDGQYFASRHYLGAYPAGWNLHATADINGDGKSDLVWSRGSDGYLAYWVMDGGGVNRHGGTVAGGDFRAIAIKDFNGDRQVDLIWTRPLNDMHFWAGDRLEHFASRQYFANYPSGWQQLTGG